MERLIPLFGYSKAETTDSYNVQEERENESRVRHWALVWWNDADNGGRRTAEIMVVTEGMADFCGGMLVYSPRVEIFKEDGAWSSNFSTAACTTLKSEELSREWEDFDPTKDALSLEELTGKALWTDEEVVTLGYKSIAGVVGGQALAYSKRGIMGADRVGGRMTRLFEVMGSTGEFACYSSYKHNVGSIKDKGMTAKSLWHTSCSVAEIIPNWHTPWRNQNSGNECHWITASVTPTCSGEPDTDVTCCYECGEEFYESSECPECGWIAESSLKSENFNESLAGCNNAAVFGSVQYRLRARRHYWRNG